MRGRATPCAFFMKDKNVRVVVHGDDFTVLGHEEDLDWFRRVISETFEVKFRGRVGPGDNDDKSIRILNRVIEWTEEGILYEADQRRAERRTGRCPSTLKQKPHRDEEDQLQPEGFSKATTVAHLGSVVCSQTL